jgi:hypothetical protein
MPHETSSILKLKCDRCPQKAQYGDKNREKCLQWARSEGWAFGPLAGQCVCPKCSKVAAKG